MGQHVETINIDEVKSSYAAKLVQISKENLGLGKHNVPFHLNFLEWFHVDL